MIAAFILHALSVGALCAAAAWTAERALAQLGGPRRMAWAFGMLATVGIASLAFRSPDSITVAAAATAGAGAGQPIQTASTVISSALIRLPPLQASDSLDRLLALAWAALSAAVLASYLLPSRRLARRARGWARWSAAQDDVLMAEDTGPAVFGLRHSRVVLPRWLAGVPKATQCLVLTHERQHVAARDPQLLALGLALFMLFPWNLPLLWQLRRMRFALEVDCDARVLANADPAEYGEALLTVSQHQGSAPAGAMALIEHPSQLERRIDIMTRGPHRFSKAVALIALGLTSICLLAATSLQAPVLAAVDAPLKPTPTGAAALKLGQHFERLLADRFPDALETAPPGSRVIVLVDADWSIANAALVTSGLGDIPVDERSFGVIGIDKQDVPYVGAMRMQSPKDPAHWLLILYTERNTPGQRFVSHLFANTRAIDRQIFQQYFPQAAKSGVPAGQRVWVLCDREGRVLRSGQESIDSASWNRTLEARFPGIRTEGVTVTPVTRDDGEPVLDGAGKPLQLVSVWLARGSSPPQG